MFNTIVVGTDGSDGAAAAADIALELAKLSGGTVHLVCVGKPVALAGVAGDPLSAAMMPALPDEAIKADLDSVLDRAAKPLTGAGVNVEKHAVLGGPAETLVAIADELNADVIVVGNRGMQGGRRFLGSVPNSITHHANCSVLLVDTSAARQK